MIVDLYNICLFSFCRYCTHEIPLNEISPLYSASGEETETEFIERAQQGAGDGLNSIERGGINIRLYASKELPTEGRSPVTKTINFDYYRSPSESSQENIQRSVNDNCERSQHNVSFDSGSTVFTTGSQGELISRF